MLTLTVSARARSRIDYKLYFIGVTKSLRRKHTNTQEKCKTENAQNPRVVAQVWLCVYDTQVYQTHITPCRSGQSRRGSLNIECLREKYVCLSVCALAGVYIIACLFGPTPRHDAFKSINCASIRMRGARTCGGQKPPLIAAHATSQRGGQNRRRQHTHTRCAYPRPKLASPRQTISFK